MTRKLFTLELDICSEYPTSELAKDCSNYGMIAKLIDANGPGGGNPVYEFASYNKDDLIAFAEVCGYDGMEEYIKEIV